MGVPEGPPCANENCHLCESYRHCDCGAPTWRSDCDQCSNCGNKLEHWAVAELALMSKRAERLEKELAEAKQIAERALDRAQRLMDEKAVSA